MKMPAQIDFIQRFKNVDFSEVTLDFAKDFVRGEAKKLGASDIVANVLVKNVFPFN
ncbi:MAG: hypothetical protein QQN55_08975 [Nitrosopumilus sp.]